MFLKLWWFVIPIAGLAAMYLIPRADTIESGVVEVAVERAVVLATYPHDPNDFCQGLVVEDEIVYEGTGHYGQSLLKKYDLSSGKVLLQTALHPSLFGEGVTIMDEDIYQLTWKERLCLVYDKNTFKLKGQLTYAGQGWGLADDGEQLYMSDGSSVIHVLDRKTLKPKRRINVYYGRKRQDKLNELEMVGGELWACIWYEDRIARIDPATGRIKGWFDCSSLYPAQHRDREHVLNGIAYDAKANRLFLTGKNWPNLFEVAVPKIDSK